MFNGFINNIVFIIFKKYFFFNNLFYFFIIKFSFLNYLDINFGSSFSLSGLCLTLIFKFLNFFEFELSQETLLFFNLPHNLLNIENSLFLYNNIDGHFLYGHINSNLLLKYIFKLYHFIKFCFFFNNINKNFIFYKYSVFINGISLTLNEINFKNNYFCLNIINFTFNLTNLKIIKLFDLLNFEFDLTIFFILNFLYLK